MGHLSSGPSSSTHATLFYTHKNCFIFFAKVYYITDGEIMHVEGGGVMSGFATNMCQHEHQKAVL